MDKSFITDNTDAAVLDTMREIEKEQQGIHIATREIAERVGCHPNTVQNAIKRLEQKGLLIVLARKGKPTYYEIR